jgi:hypothetical protein
MTKQERSKKIESVRERLYLMLDDLVDCANTLEECNKAKDGDSLRHIACVIDNWLQNTKG